MMVGEDVGELARLRKERDLYRRLLDLGTEEALVPLLRQALALVVEATGAHRGYLEVENGDAPASRRWWITHEFDADEVACVRGVISRGIIAAALAAGEAILTASASLDPRFSSRASVKAARIDAVLCAPIATQPTHGALYLESATSFTQDDKEKAELFMRHLAPLADRLVARGGDPDPTAVYREKLRLESLVGRSTALAAMLAHVTLVAPLNVHVLLTGDSGTGKSHVARVIHDNGPRVTRPFVELNCAALPDTLLESELFGALPGAHSTATHKIPGKVAAAEHGTLFLDEIGELSLSAQAKLLHLLHGGQYYPLGSTRASTADVRIIAATNIDLKTAIAERRFREDLFYRLEVLPFRIPTLAERREDIPDLAAHFCQTASVRHGFQRLDLSSGALHAVHAADWPGNVRQLAHAVEAAVIRAAGEQSMRVEARHVFPDVHPATAPASLTFQEATRRFHAQLLRDALDDSGWNVTDVARRLDLARSHVYTLIRGFGITRDAR